MLEFNSDGSIKFSENQIKQNELEKQNIVITREQISVKPAKAQIRIKFPEDVQNPDEIIKFYNIIDDSEFKSVDHSISQIDKQTFIIKVDRGSMLMYGLLNFLIDCFKGHLSQRLRYNQGVIVKGIWANYGNRSIF